MEGVEPVVSGLEKSLWVLVGMFLSPGRMGMGMEQFQQGLRVTRDTPSLSLELRRRRV